MIRGSITASACEAERRVALRCVGLVIAAIPAATVAIMLGSHYLIDYFTRASLSTIDWALLIVFLLSLAALGVGIWATRNASKPEEWETIHDDYSDLQ